MKTIGAKELRTNFNQIFDQVANGEKILVSHRFKKHPIPLSAVYDNISKISGDRRPGLIPSAQLPKKLTLSIQISR